VRADPNTGRALRPDAGRLQTDVQLTWFEGRIKRRIRFGHDCGETILNRRRRILRFTPRNILRSSSWASNDFDTIVSRIDIVRAIDRAESYQTLPFVRPGGEILLRISGWPKVERVLQAIDAVEALGIDPAVAAPIIGGVSTAASSPVRRRGPTAAGSIAPERCAGDLCHDALRLRHHHLRRDALRRANERLPSRAEAAVERQRQRASRVVRGTAGSSASCRRAPRGHAT
jgi:Protein of unknown function (DUF2840)